MSNGSEHQDWHYLEWDDASVARFWNFAAKWEPWQNDYFSKQAGAGIVKFLQYVVPFQGRVLDYGCGPGYMTEHLLGAGISCEAVDSSPETVRLINEKFATNPLWRGAKVNSGSELPFPDDTFDLIICLETIEHVLVQHRDGLLNELRRVLKRDSGRLFMTTPNNEDLLRSQVYCAECGSVFHRYQHVASFSVQTLDALLTEHRFTTILCDATEFRKFSIRPQRPASWNFRKLLGTVKQSLHGVSNIAGAPGTPFGQLRFQSLIGEGPHLFWLGGKYKY